MKIRSSNFKGLLIMLMVMGVVGCQNNANQKKKPDQSVATKPAGTAKVETPMYGADHDTSFVSHEFSYGALAFEVFKADTNKIKSLFLDPVTLKIEKKTNSEGGTYDQYYFTDGINDIILYRNDGGFYIDDADIKNDRMLLNKKISFGMKQTDLLELLKVKNIKCDSITVADEESTFESVYIFKDDRLCRIKMGSTVE